MNRMIVAKELAKVAKLLVGEWRPVRRDVDVGRRNKEVNDSLTSYAPSISKIIRQKAVGMLAEQGFRINPGELNREWSRYLAFVEPESNANKYHYYVIFSFDAGNGKGTTLYSAFNCSGRIGIVERIFDLTEKFMGGAVNSMQSAVNAAERHMDTKIRKGYEPMPMIRG